jgi:hypothetical protein
MDYTPSKLLNGETETLRQQTFTRWLSRDLSQAAVDFGRNLGRLPIYAECSPTHQTRFLFWSPPQDARMEVRSCRTKDQFDKLDGVNRERNMPLLSLHINDGGIHSAVWISTNHLDTARSFLKTHGITSAEKA